MWNADQGPLAWWRRKFAQEDQGAASTDSSSMEPPSPPRQWIDEDGLLHQLSGDRALLQELTRLFEVERDRRLVVLRAAVAAQDSREIKSCAHAIKSGLTNFSAPGAVALAAEIEMAGRAGMAGDPSAVVGLEPQVNALSECISEMLHQLHAMGEPE